MTEIPSKDKRNCWYEYREDSDTAIVFVHGILSNCRDCWYHRNKDKAEEDCYWPQLIVEDGRFQRASIYLAGFNTQIAFAPQGIRECAKEVFEWFDVEDFELRPPPLKKDTLVFICHSTGGLVTRYMLERYSDDFKEKEIRLLLYASPSYGSKLANSLRIPAWIFDNQLARELRWGSDNIVELDDRWNELMSKKYLPGLDGREGYETKFLSRRLGIPIPIKVVTPRSAKRYFLDPKPLPYDHFGIVKPNSVHHESHRLLWHTWSKLFAGEPDVEREKILPKVEKIEKFEEAARGQIVEAARVHAERFKRIVNTINTFCDYKALHDMLHQLEDECGLLQDIIANRHSTNPVRKLEGRHYKLMDFLGVIRRIEEKESDAQEIAQWMREELEGAQKSFRSALQDDDVPMAPGPMSLKVSELEQTMRWQKRIDDKFAKLIDELDFEGLRNAIEQIKSGLERQGANGGVLRMMTDILSRLDSLDFVQTRSLVRLQGLLQRLYWELLSISRDGGPGSKEFHMKVDGFNASIEEVITDFNESLPNLANTPADVRMEKFHSSWNRLHNAFQASDEIRSATPDNELMLWEEFRSDARACFVLVDKRLKDRCEDLRSIGERVGSVSLLIN